MTDPKCPWVPMVEPADAPVGTPVPTVFDPHQLYALLQPVREQVDNERVALTATDRDSEVGALTALSTAIHQVVMLGFLVSTIRRETDVTTEDVEHRFRLAAADAETARLLGSITGGA